MSAICRPKSLPEIESAVNSALLRDFTIEIVGNGSHKALGREVEAHVTLDMSDYSGVVLYEPDELILTVRSGTPMSEIDALLNANRQHLPFDPPNYCPLWGGEGSRRTIGGALAIGFGGSRRVTAGAPRDYFLGVKGVNGYGDAFSAGGRVVKNVTGYDLPKLLAGSFGTLCVLADITLKVLPSPECTVTLAGITAGPESVTHLRYALDRGIASSAAYVGGPCSKELVPELGNGQGLLLFRIEGFKQDLQASTGELKDALRERGIETSDIDPAMSALIWERLGGGHLFATGQGAVWRLTVGPSYAPNIVGGLSQIGVQNCVADWGGGLIWAELPSEMGNGSAVIRDLVGRLAKQGRSILMRKARDQVDEECPFEPLPSGIASISRRIKQQFDPQGLLNPGRMYRNV